MAMSKLYARRRRMWAKRHAMPHLVRWFTISRWVSDFLAEERFQESQRFFRGEQK